MELERRGFALDAVSVERREAKEPPRIMYHAAVFNEWTVVADLFRERVMPGAFRNAIDKGDIRALFNHNPDMVLGRNRARPTPTLSLAEDARGLAATAIPPDTQWARDLIVSIERGDISGASFGFRAIKQEWNWEPKLPERTLLEVELLDVSPVTFPQYPETDVALRSLEEFRKLHAPARGLTTASAAAVVRKLTQRARDRGH